MPSLDSHTFFTVMPSLHRSARCFLLPLAAAAGLSFLLTAAAWSAEQPEPQSLLYETHIRPIFQARCVGCHGEETRKAELNLSGPAEIVQGGESGEVIVAGEPQESLLFELVRGGDMPPDGEEPLSPEEVEKIGAWIEAGAPLADEGPVKTSESTLDQFDVIPIMLRRCTMCHGSGYQEGELDLRSKAAMLSGGAHGPAIVPGDPDASPLVRRVSERKCPPEEAIGEAGIEPMTAQELATVSKWIARGARRAPLEPSPAATADDPLVTDEDRQFWSFQPPARSPLPEVRESHLVRTPIDAFLLAQLEEHELRFSPEASRLQLLRRATYDLTGLPPTPEQIDRFVNDPSPRAYENLIDRLLASPRYGERWGRFWLDLAGYSDSEGKRNADLVRPYAYRYRDYVIRSFNADKPYDEFLLEQLAGDELVDYADADAVTDEAVEKLVATGFLRMAPDGTSADPVNRFSDRLEVISDEIDIFTRGVLGLTLQCAQCHSHKYDPIPQRDYYRFVAVFKGAYDEYNWMTPQPFGNQWKKAKHRHLEVATPEQREDVERHNAPLKAKIAKLEEELEQEETKKADAKKIKKQLSKFEGQLRELPKIRALWDRGEPSPTFIYRRGDETQPTRMVTAGVPAALSDPDSPLEVEPPDHLSEKTGRRLALARWVTRQDSPAAGLAARVIVNRVWQRHFGTGIVESVDNFGRLGTPPSHPKLLDWLAAEFMEGGWSFKRLHRLIMSSAAYRQDSNIKPEHGERDPENRLLSRMPMRRLDAEQLRDSMLAAAGELSQRPFGPPDRVEVRKDGLVTGKRTNGGWRRSVYLRQRRKEMPTVLETFDLPQMNPNCTQRKDSTVVSQPLYLLHNRMVHELATALARRVENQAEDDPVRQVEQAYLLTWGRPPTDRERQTGIEALDELTRHWQHQSAASDQPELDGQQRALADFCHTLFNSAGFLFID